jgi:methylenetetrahydrofolate reductase (NADPH)
MKLSNAFNRKRFVVTTEIQAPFESQTQSLLESLKTLRGRVDGFSISEVEMEGVVGSSLQTCVALKENRFEPIYQTTTRDKSRLDLQRDLVKAHDAGIENLLVFTEDYRITGDSLQEMMFFHVDAGKLQSVLEHLRSGATVEGERLPFKAEFTLGSGIDAGWGKNVPDLELRELEEMTRIGAGYFLTTPVFDVDRFAKFIQRIDTFGIPVIAEVLILRTAGMAQFLNRHLKSGLVPDWIIKKLAQASDKQKASIELFTDIVAGLKDICQGVHIISIGQEEKLRHYLDAAKLV